MQDDQLNTQLIPAINESLDLSISSALSVDELKSILAAHVNELIQYDFEKLIYYLYRIDVDERKMRTVLDSNRDTDASSMIADMIIDRQLEKIKSRQENRRDNIIDEDESW